MKKEKIVIIGAVTAGGSAAFKISRLNPQAAITVIEQDRHFSYAACGLPYYLSGEVNDYRKMIARGEKDYLDANINLLTRHRALQLEPSKNTVVVAAPDGGGTKTIFYDQLVLATGARAVVPPLEGTNLKGVYALRTLQQGVDLKKYLQRAEIKKTVIVGGSYLGLELAEAFKTLGFEVRLLEKMSAVMGTMDSDMAAHLENEVINQGVLLHKGETLIAFEGDATGSLKAVVTDKGSYEADLAVLALGVKPNTTLAAEAGIKLGIQQAVAVDQYLRTSVDNIYAAGDCAETYHRLLGKNVYIPLGTTANRQGRLAGENVCGKNACFPGVLGSAVIKVFNLSAGRTGLSEAEARAHNLPCRSTVIKTLDHAAYYPGAAPLLIKLVFNPGDGKILGGQIVGSLKAVKRVDTIATAISAGLTAGDLASVDFSYAPPFSRVWEGLTLAANAAGNELKK